MAFTSLEILRWVLGALFELVVLILALRHRVFERLPFFTAYLGLLVVGEGVGALTYGLAGVRSHAAFFIFWGLQALLLITRGAVVFELCRTLLGPYAGVWRFCRGFLIAVAVFLVASAFVAAWQSGPHLSPFVITGERGLELAIVGILLFGLAFCRYYRIRVENYLAWIGLGLGFYSAVQVTNNTVLHELFRAYFPLWANLRLVSFQIALIFWLVALRKPLPAMQPAPELLRRGEYETLVPQVNARLQELNSRLLEMWK